MGEGGERASRVGGVERFSICWLTPQMATMGRAGPVQSWEAGASSKFPMKAPCTAFPGNQQGDGLEVEQLEPELCHIGHRPHRQRLSHRVTVPAP